jgi:hypothetical protein
LVPHRIQILYRYDVPNLGHVYSWSKYGTAAVQTELLGSKGRDVVMDWALGHSDYMERGAVPFAREH